MRELPSRHQSSWKSYIDFTTRYADPVVMHVMRREGDSSFSDGFVAFPISALPSLAAVRIDFGTILTHRYCSEQLGTERDAVGFQVTDESDFKAQQLAGYPYDKVYDRAVDAGPAEEVYRHFRLSFGDYGIVDVLARHARVLKFERTLEAVPVSQFEGHEALLRGAIALGWTNEWPS